MELVNTLGRRKSAVARIYLSEGKGNITVNKRELKEYFPNTTLQYIVKQPLNLMEAQEKYDINVNLGGGGPKGQAEALRLAISRALLKVDPESRKELKAAGFLTRDPREVERKKPGQPKARKKFQFSKR
ncbi:MAG: 30S ribosomal protein S9 [Prolixibacteraceae bacterium]|jgi:small subunit ribosomal protein S9|nr:30S ribosomal protein S9 [Prolixibacteraceae bacterium]MBT6007397.1 30S ribosomal protein S9 [Prolixibacteraceae bacterium]MBT6763789.1 30S ribosomal protein S9 [Prolixibacteraceae bacterium]MBT7001046.1 30S ribosomal protein S9 [Prolixibacteraceae bacterium]MBT7393666.1 30S ribosomal protein S9 [Prolixibacteraceae bacterium]